MRKCISNGTKMLYDGIGTRIKELRCGLKINQTELAEKMTAYFIEHDFGDEEFTKNSIERFENNRKHFDNIEYIIAFADILKTDCDYLMRNIKPDIITADSEHGLSNESMQELRTDNSEKTKRKCSPLADAINELDQRIMKLRKDVCQIQMSAGEIMEMTFEARNILNDLKERWEEQMSYD